MFEYSNVQDDRPFMSITQGTPIENNFVLLIYDYTSSFYTISYLTYKENLFFFYAKRTFWTFPELILVSLNFLYTWVYIVFIIITNSILRRILFLLTVRIIMIFSFETEVYCTKPNDKSKTLIESYDVLKIICLAYTYWSWGNSYSFFFSC